MGEIIDMQQYRIKKLASQRLIEVPRSFTRKALEASMSRHPAGKGRHE